MQRWSEADFERLSWHDDTLYGVRFELGDIARGDWRSELVLDLDHIVEWVCGSAGRMRFRVAPATLIFHDTTDLRIALDWGDSGHRTALSEPQIDAITRAPVQDQKICLDRPYQRWRIALSWPAGGALEFGASGFTQTLRATPTLLDDQRLPPPPGRNGFAEKRAAGVNGLKTREFLGSFGFCGDRSAALPRKTSSNARRRAAAPIRLLPFTDEAIGSYSRTVVKAPRRRACAPGWASRPLGSTCQAG